MGVCCDYNDKRKILKSKTDKEKDNEKRGRIPRQNTSTTKNDNKNNPQKNKLNNKKTIQGDKKKIFSESTPNKSITESYMNKYEKRKQNKKKDNNGINNKNEQKDNNNKSRTTNNVSYSDLKLSKDYYLVCPDCKNLYPYIKDLYYDKEKKDFNISYTCECFKGKSTLQNSSYLIYFIADNKPTTIYTDLISKKNLDKMKQLLTENKREFQGYKIVNNILKDIIINESVAPLANTLGISNRSITKSKFKESDVHIEISANYNIKESESDILFEEQKRLNEKKENLSIINEEQNEEKNELKNYKCTKTITCDETILSLIELKSGLIATGSIDSKIYIWNIEKSFYIKGFQENAAINCLLEFEQNFLLSGNDRNNIYLWNIEEEDKYISEFIGHKLSVNCLVKCNNNCFASGSNDKTIKIWDYKKRKLYKTIDAQDDGILCLILLKNGNLCSGSKDKYVKIWNLQNSTNIDKIRIDDNSVQCLLQLEDEKILIGSGKNIIIWKNHEKIRYLDGHNDQVNSLFKIDDNYIISSSSDKTIKIWDIKNMNYIQELNGHNDAINCVIKLKNSSLASCSYDKTIKIWEQC